MLDREESQLCQRQLQCSALDDREKTMVRSFLKLDEFGRLFSPHIQFKLDFSNPATTLDWIDRPNTIHFLLHVTDDIGESDA
jgi:hypothetical protein